LLINQKKKNNLKENVMNSVNLSQIMKKHNLHFGILEGDLDFCIVPQKVGTAVYFKGIRFANKKLYRNSDGNLKMPLRNGPFGYTSEEISKKAP